jgi:hypothetical protein
MNDDADTIAAFDLPDSGTPTDDGEWVLYPDSLLMEVGDYTRDKGIRLDPEDLIRAEEEFSGPVPNLFHHAETFGLKHDLKGLLGDTRDVWTEDGGKRFKANVAIPKPLDDLWSRSGKPKRISTEWDPQTKRFRGVSLCVSEPYIPTAALMSTFAAMQSERTYDGLSILQQLHDSAARAGAVCSAASSRKPGDALFHSAAELAAIQKVHDVVVTGGAKCNIMPPPKSGNGDTMIRSYFAGTGNWKVGAARDLPLLDDNDAGWDGPAAEKSIFGDGDTVPADARRAFLVYDASAPDLKGSYKLPFAVRKDDGKLYASRAGLRIAATRIPKTDADEAALTRARAVVDGYQARFAKLDKGGKDKGGAATFAKNRSTVGWSDLDAMDDPGLYGQLLRILSQFVGEDGRNEGAVDVLKRLIGDSGKDASVNSKRGRKAADEFHERLKKAIGQKSAAFAAPIRHESATTYMQSVHDAAAEMDPAVCEPGTKAARPDKAKGKDMPAAFADHPEQFKAIKAMHDMAVKHGATCPGVARTAAMSSGTPPAFRKGGNPPAAPARGGGHRKMNWREKLAALFGTEPDNLPPMDEEVARTGVSLFTAGPGEVTVEDETMTQTTMNTTAAETPAAPDPAATFAALLAKNAELEDRIRRQEEEDQRRRVHELDQQAATFAADLCRDVRTADGTTIPARITPAAASVFAALYRQAAQDDARDQDQAVVTFSAGGQEQKASRVEALEAAVKALPGHGLLGQQLDPSGRLDPAKAVVLFHDPSPADQMSEERRKALLAHTPLGQAALNAAGRNGTN